MASGHGGPESEAVVERGGIGLEAERARRFEAHLSVLLVNVDGLGTLNEAVGRAACDDVLSTVSALLRQQCRKIDVFGRWDAEDFIILTVDRNSYGSLALAEKLRRAVSDHAFTVRGREHRLTVSIGVARGIPASEEEIDTLVEQARTAVARAKSLGRNRVEYADGPVEPSPADEPELPV
jgi:polar amino acid transport system substrate-binding protein